MIDKSQVVATGVAAYMQARITRTCCPGHLWNISGEGFGRYAAHRGSRHADAQQVNDGGYICSNYVRNKC